MDADRRIQTVRLFDDDSIEIGRQRFHAAFAVVDPDLDEFGFDADVVLDSGACLRGRRHEIHHVRTRGMTLRARARPRHAGARGFEPRRARHDFIAYTHRQVAPIGAAAFAVRAIHEVADTDDTADAVECHAL